MVMQPRRIVAVFAALVLILGAMDADARRRKKKRSKRNPKAPTGAVVIKCTMSGALVYLDDNEVGKTPIKQLAVPVGEHTIKVKKLGFLYFTRKVKVEKGKTIRLKADLLPFAGAIYVSSRPKKARVLVDGEEVGITPVEYEVKLGKRLIEVKADGYKTYKKNIRSTPGKRYKIKAKLKRGKDPEPDPPAVAALTPDGAGAAPADETAAGGENDLALAALEPPAGGTDDLAGDDLALAMPDLADPSLALPSDSAAGDEDLLALGGDLLALEAPTDSVPEGDLMALEGLPGDGLELTAPNANDPISLTALPGMAPADTKPKGPVPLHKRWYFITGVAGGVIALATAIIVPVAVVASQPPRIEDTGPDIEIIWGPGTDPTYPAALLRFH